MLAIAPTAGPAAAERRTTTMSLDDNKAVVRRQYEEGLNRRNLGIMSECLTADYVHHMPMSPEPLGLGPFEEMLNGFLAAFPDMQVTLEDLVAEGDRVAARTSFRGTHRGEFMGIPATGKQVAFTGNDIYRIVDGRIAEEWAQFDALGLMQQLGAVPLPAAAM
jgi:steroid delta-isomerase-like uncharacterized protein